MKKIFMTLAIACMAVMPIMAQNNKVAKQQLTPEQRTEHKANVLSDRMMLDDATKAKFVPMYKEYLNELNNVCPVKMDMGKTCSELTEKEISERIEKRFEMKQKRLDIQKKYYKKFKSVLNARQLQQIFCNKGQKKRPFGKMTPRMNFKGNKALKCNKKNMRNCEGACRAKGGNCNNNECTNKECPNK
ncbi:hypothetical protein [Prevotella sp.]|uniref:hypothetical protein n=1 Tax=Prevotella sp. TaxID=59823 RepID=UPI003AB38BFA